MDTGTDTLLKFDIRHRAFPVQENSGSCLYEKIIMSARIVKAGTYYL